MPRPSKPYNNGTWTQARFNAFIKGALRAASNRWGPKFSVLKKARVERGVYVCNGYNRRRHNVPVSIVIGKRRFRNVAVDHINPVGKCTDWNTVIKRMFVEEDGLQVLCKECHDKKTQDEKRQAKE